MKKIIISIIFILVISSINFVSAEKIENNLEKSSLPAYFNWRDIDEVDYCTEIKDQSPAPTCEAYALVASLETKMQYQLQELYDPDLSEAHLYFYPGGTIEQGYVHIEDAAQYLVDYGVPDEGCFPDPHRNFDTPFESLEGWEERTIKIQDWGWIELTAESIKSALIEYGPLPFCIRFPQNFYNYYGGVFKYKGEDMVGGHVVTIVGYDDSKECWIIKNSWGTKWGEDGWCRISYDSEEMIAQWYGPGTGVMYLDGLCGNFKPDVPKIKISKPTIKHTYIFGIELPIIFKKLNIQAAAPRIFGGMRLKVDAENTNKVEFYVDGELTHTDDEAPFNWWLKQPKGLHTIEAFAYNDTNISKAIVDIYSFF